MLVPEGPRDRGDCRECAQLGGSSSSAPSRPIPWTKWAKWRWTKWTSLLAPALLVSLSRAKRTKLKKAPMHRDDVKIGENTLGDVRSEE